VSALKVAGSQQAMSKHVSWKRDPEGGEAPAAPAAEG
jgi:hypothetical protein